ncbi:MAG: hypothetical protein P1U34_12490 [Coxiellaceae bacterium]|nr:hypothetical protein [Coxiellaceae bacterium]
MWKSKLYRKMKLINISLIGVLSFFAINLVFAANSKLKVMESTVCHPGSPAPVQCIPPDSPVVGYYSYLSSIVGSAKNKKTTTTVASYGSYHYFMGACTLTYTPDPSGAGGGSFSCRNDAALSNTQKPMKSFFVNDDSDVGFIGIQIDPSAASRIGSDASAWDSAATVVSNKVNQYVTKGWTLGWRGALLDFGTATTPEEQPLLSINGMKFAQAVSERVLTSTRLFIRAGIPGGLNKKPPTSGPGIPAQSYTWNFWSAVNRSTKEGCTEDDQCYMGAFIYPIYDKVAEPYIYHDLAVTNPRTQVFNMGIRDFPFQMRVVSTIAAEIEKGRLYLTTIIPPFYAVINQIQPVRYPAPSAESQKAVNVGTPYGAPFGYYQLGVTLASSTKTSPTFGTWDSTRADPILTQQAFFWGTYAKGFPESHIVATTPMPYSNTGCREKNKAFAPNCGVLVQQETNLKYNTPFTVIEIMNQYICTQFNAITFVYNNGATIKTPSEGGFCSIVDRANPKIYLTFKNLTDIIFHDGRNSVFPYRQSGFGTMIGPTLYGWQKIPFVYGYCAGDAKSHSIPGSCILIPKITEVSSGFYRPIEKIIYWLDANVSTATTPKPCYYGECPSTNAKLKGN